MAISTASVRVFCVSTRARTENELDVCPPNSQNKRRMKSTVPFSCSPAFRVTALSALSLFCLSSCDDKEETKQPEETTVEPTPAPEAAAPAADTLAEAREALFNEAVYELAQKVSDPALFPELNEEVKVMLELMETYYAELAKNPEGSMERTRLALQIAGTLRDLSSNKAYDAYTRAQSELAALPEDIRNSADGKHCAGDIENGLGSCLLMQRKTAEAMPHYEAALAIAQEQFDAVAPAEGAAPAQGEVAPELSRAATDLLDSLRCLGDCQRMADDPEEARTTYMKGQEIVTRLKTLSSSMSVSYVKLLTALGNLDNSAGRSKEALSAWVLGANICKQLNNSSPRLDVKAQTKRCYDALIPAIQAVANSLNAAAGEEQAPADNNAQTEPITPELKAAAAEAAKNAPEAPAPAPAAAPAPAKPAPTPAKPANRRKRK